MKDDLIRRKDAIDAIMGEFPEPHYPDWYAFVIDRVPSAQFATDINVGHTIYRQQAIDAVAKWFYDVFGIKESDGTATIFKQLRELPPAQPSYTDEEIQKMSDLEQAEIEKAYQLGYEEGKKDAQPAIDEWCTDCKEYDSDAHCCPRFNRVIRDALKGSHLKQNGYWIYECTDYNGNDLFRCSECNSFDRHDGASPYCWHCGARMIGGEDNETN